jgi:flavin-dependent dehydrogenase
MKIGIVGARVAGSYVGLLLSRLGHEVILLDPSIEQEKPCGGGVTAKALRRMSWFHEHPPPHSEIALIRLVTHEGYTGDLPLPHPIHVFSRLHLDAFLHQWAVKSGVQFRPERVLHVASGRKGWSIETSAGGEEVDFLIGADGAGSVVRATLVGRYSSSNLILALGYNLPGLLDPGMLQVNFQESGFQGYLWSFPCVDHSSVGIGRWLPKTVGSDLRKRVEHFIEARYPGVGSDKKFYAALIPCLSRTSLVSQRVCGKNWALLGDAAGFTDAITAEGIYYALRSAELLADSFQKGNPLRYESAWRHDFGTDLESAAAWRDRFYGSMVLAHTFIKRALQTVRYSETARGLLDSLIAGHITCNSLFRNLVLRSPSILLQAFRNKARNRMQDVGSWD